MVIHKRISIVTRGGALRLTLAFINNNINTLSISVKNNPNAQALLTLGLIKALVLVLN